MKFLKLPAMKRDQQFKWDPNFQWLVLLLGGAIIILDSALILK